MSYDTKKIFWKIFPARLFLGPINSLENSKIVQIGENLLIFLYKIENPLFFDYKGNLCFIKENEQIIANLDNLGIFE